MTEDTAGPAQAPRTLLRVVRGEPSAEELAALVAVLTARSAALADTDRPAAAASGWSDRRAALTPSPAPGPRAWALSGRTFGVRTRAGW